MSDTETKTIEGVCSEISERGDWTTFHVDVGSQYPVKLSTKVAPLIELGRAASKDGGRFTWTFKESQGNENPNRPGTYYTNRYLSGVEPADSVPDSPPSGGARPNSEGMSKDEWKRKDDAAHKRACIAIAVSALTHTLPSDPTPEDLNKFGERVAILSSRWHLVVLATRDDPAGDEVPF